MYDLPEKICIVVPCYNESKRFNFREFNGYDPNCYFIFVNDGSRDNTLEILEENRDNRTYILNLDRNVGKGEAIRKGFLYLKTLKIYEDIRWAGYWDADLATSLYEISNYILYSKNFYDNVDAVWGSRVKRLGSRIERQPARHYIGRAFATLAGLVLKINSYDSQCGAKIFRKELIDEYFEEPFISRWIFDIELLLRMKGKNIIEYPLKEWKDVKGGKFKICKFFPQALLDIIKLKAKYKRA